MTKKEIAQAEAVKTLKDWGVVENSIIYAKVTRVSASGMSRRVQLFIIGEGYAHEKLNAKRIIDITYWSAIALGWNWKDGYNGGIGVSGCGMDMLFHTVGSLSYAMGYGAISQRDEEKKGLKYRQL